MTDRMRERYAAVTGDNGKTDECAVPYETTVLPSPVECIDAEITSINGWWASLDQDDHIGHRCMASAIIALYGARRRLTDGAR